MPPPPTDAHGRVDNRRGPGPPGQSITTPHPGLGPTAVSPGPHWTHAYVIVLTRSCWTWSSVWTHDNQHCRAIFRKNK